MTGGSFVTMSSKAAVTSDAASSSGRTSPHLARPTTAAAALFSSVFVVVASFSSAARTTSLFSIVVVVVVVGESRQRVLVALAHHGRPIHHDDVVALVLLAGLVEELLVEEVPDGSTAGRAGCPGGRVAAPAAALGGDLVPAGAVPPVDGVLVLDLAVDLPAHVGVPEGDAVPLLRAVVPTVGLAAGKSGDLEAALQVVLDLQGGDRVPLELRLPLAVPPLRPLLGLVLVVDVHPPDAHGGSGEGPDDGARLSGGFGADLLHGVLDLLVADGVHDVHRLPRLQVPGSADHLVRQELHVLLGLLVVADVHEGDCERRLLLLPLPRDALGGRLEGLLEPLRIVGLARRQHQDAAGPLVETGLELLLQHVVHRLSHDAGSARDLGGDHLLDVPRGLDVPKDADLRLVGFLVELAVVRPPEADDVQPVGIDLADLLDDPREGHDGLLPPGGIHRQLLLGNGVVGVQELLLPDHRRNGLGVVLGVAATLGEAFHLLEDLVQLHGCRRRRRRRCCCCCFAGVFEKENCCFCCCCCCCC
mmetsp:Transcript_1296/g.3159  ORF Transcript_1296/g.3159 Transcript_1296/m.3159 type:complete len:532 (+) Transcript_1296:2047-3642(+)